MSASPFDDIHALIAGLPPMPAPALPPDPGLGRLGELLAWLSRWRGPRPTINRPILAIYAASHGVAGRPARRRRTGWPKGRAQGLRPSTWPSTARSATSWRGRP
jgi:hypothetical protein